MISYGAPVISETLSSRPRTGFESGGGVGAGDNAAALRSTREQVGQDGRLVKHPATSLRSAVQIRAGGVSVHSRDVLKIVFICRRLQIALPGPQTRARLFRFGLYRGVELPSREIVLCDTFRSRAISVTASPALRRSNAN